MSLAIVIPNYNKAPYLEKCIGSVLNQTLVPDEIIIIDDCSTDQSREIIEKLRQQSQRIKPILLEKNVGVSAARNIGIKQATTEYITTLDSDDFLFQENKLEMEMKALAEAESRTGYQCFAYSRTVYVDEQGNEKKMAQLPQRVFLQGDIFEPLLARYNHSQTTPRDYCIKRQYVLDAGLFDENSRYFEDLDLLLRICTVCKAVYTGNPGVAYRQVDSGLSRQNHERYVKTIREIQNKYYKQMHFKSKCKYTFYKIMLLARRIKNKVCTMLHR